MKHFTYEEMELMSIYDPGTSPSPSLVSVL